MSDVAEQEPLECLPDGLVAALEVRDRWRQQVAAQSTGLEFIVSDLARWPVGSRVRVAFLDGDKALHAKIVEATAQLTDNANLVLDFGLDATTGEFRRWTTNDTTYAAEIRVSFDQPGFWSMVGTDSNDPTLGSPLDLSGGRPNQRSLNLGKFKEVLPARWQGVVRHEFLHAIAFTHEHQNMRGPCEDEFRWEDDAGYVPTTDARGVFVPDAAGRRPGIYTYLAGPPNEWPRPKVDHNLRTSEDPTLVAGPFDNKSIMLYQFAAFFYKSNPSSCAPKGDGINLSEEDVRGLRLLYPEVADELSARANEALKELMDLGSGTDALGGGNSAYYDRATELLRAF
ncbi:hypothetical protein JIG36_34170 [Actinoplanes sp. LDG1-06]|uniref:Peptidase metallopeptidase domain-containing protein n=1 Tax=Paractinoplanes ovalisporus TaxID=2810368 RepID=A0ABS2AL69_9ACTN|nr:hypothetical protein [Actinoplanes ovalisporus]MBM2620560.1 hypothetical protein [Actinoplanes ovalisporus]